MEYFDFNFLPIIHIHILTHTKTLTLTFNPSLFNAVLIYNFYRLGKIKVTNCPKKKVMGLIMTGPPKSLKPHSLIHMYLMWPLNTFQNCNISALL